MSSTFAFLQAPHELRDTVYSYVALNTGINLVPEDGGRPMSNTALSLVSRQCRAEFLGVLHESAADVTAFVIDFDFAHVLKFLDQLDERVRNQSLRGVEVAANQRAMQVVLKLTAASPSPARANLNSLHEWLKRCSGPDHTHHFQTEYAMVQSNPQQDKNVIAPITLMRIHDEINFDWFSTAFPGPFKEEVGKLCACLGTAEIDINRRRSAPVRVAPPG